MACISEQVAQAEDWPQSLPQFFHSLQLKANATAEKFAKVARDIKEAADEEAEFERRMQDRQDDYWAARRADREALDGSDE